MEASRTAEPLREEIKRRLTSLPMLPTIVSELLSLDADADDFIDQVTYIAEREPFIAARLIAVANGATCSPIDEITGLPEAVVRLGARRVTTLITSFAVMHTFAPKTEDQRGVWRHALQTAVAAQSIASRANWGVDPQQAYVAGLLHDIGRFVTIEFDAQGSGVGVPAEWREARSLMAQERQRWGIDHCEAGLLAAREWWLPRSIIDVIKAHHLHGNLGDKVEPASLLLLRIVQQAICLSCVLLGGVDGFLGEDEELRVEALGSLCICPGWGRPPLPAPELYELLPDIRDRSGRLIASLGL